MAPNTTERDISLKEPRFEKPYSPQEESTEYALSYSYANLVVYGYFHVAGFYGLYLCFTEARWLTILLACVLHEAGIIGTTAGVHRLWSHRTYKANLPLQIILVILQSIASQNSVIHWAQNHRLHHKYTDTDADPHNAERGFFFSHIGWQLVRKHPEARKKRRTIDMSDLYKNPLLRFQNKYALPVIGTISYIIPTVLPMYCWGESLRCAWNINILRVIFSLHITFLINSAAHYYGNKPYDKFISPTQSVSLSIATLGEGYHNYHHVFPWDYRAAELGNNVLNFTTLFINFFAWIGWAYELKTVSSQTVLKRVEKTGDGTNLWGWGDKDLPETIKEATTVLCAKRNVNF